MLCVLVYFKFRRIPKAGQSESRDYTPKTQSINTDAIPADIEHKGTLSVNVRQIPPGSTAIL